jgi:hypothetical protein
MGATVKDFFFEGVGRVFEGGLYGGVRMAAMREGEQEEKDDSASEGLAHILSVLFKEGASLLSAHINGLRLDFAIFCDRLSEIRGRRRTGWRSVAKP